MINNRQTIHLQKKSLIIIFIVKVDEFKIKLLL